MEGSPAHPDPAQRRAATLRSLRILCLPGAALLSALYCGHPDVSGPRFGSPVPSGAALAMRAELEGQGGAVPAGLVRARTLAEQLRTGVEPGRVAAVRQELATVVAALGRLPEAPSLPWGRWLEDSVQSLPDLALALFLEARAALGPAALPLALRHDAARTPWELRLAIQETLWALDPVEGFNRTRKLLEERRRANDPLPAEVVERVLAPSEAPEAEALLRQVALRGSMDPRARVLAIKALERRDARSAAADVESVFLSETNNLLVQQAALRAVLELDPPRGKRLLSERVPDPALNPALYENMRRLRLEHGLPPLPPATP